MDTRYRGSNNRPSLLLSPTGRHACDQSSTPSISGRCQRRIVCRRIYKVMILVMLRNLAQELALSSENSQTHQAFARFPKFQVFLVNQIDGRNDRNFWSMTKSSKFWRRFQLTISESDEFRPDIDAEIRSKSGRFMLSFCQPNLDVDYSWSKLMLFHKCRNFDYRSTSKFCSTLSVLNSTRNQHRNFIRQFHILFWPKFNQISPSISVSDEIQLDFNRISTLKSGRKVVQFVVGM